MSNADKTQTLVVRLIIFDWYNYSVKYQTVYIFNPKLVFKAFALNSQQVKMASFSTTDYKQNHR
jgi:hypothetical protein